MTDVSKIKPAHTQRSAFVYIRQSTASQVEHNRESTQRQYALVDRAGSANGSTWWTRTLECPVPAPTNVQGLPV